MVEYLYEGGPCAVTDPRYAVGGVGGGGGLKGLVPPDPTSYISFLFKSHDALSDGFRTGDVKRLQPGLKKLISRGYTVRAQLSELSKTAS